jgi:regulator of sirC expression with transglutaminase-like and TPR domain
MLLPTVLRNRRGTCLGLAQFYLVVAQRIDLELSAVVVPGHLYLRAPGPVPNNIELLRRGIRRSDPFYRSMFQVPEGVAAYMRPLSGDELLGVVHYNLGNAARVRGDLDLALRHATVAVRLFDDYPDAHAARGLVFQLRGDVQAAETAYGRAHALYPGLAGLSENIKALHSQR